MLTSTQPQLFAIAPECTMSEILGVVQSIAIDRPEILRRIDADLDAAAIVKKRERQADAAWNREKRDGKISQDLAPVNTVPPPTALAPHGGRPRTPTMIVLAGVFIRGQYGSLTAADVRDRLKDSSAFAALLWRFDLDNLEATVLARHVNNLSDGTVDLIFQAQIASFRRERLDDFELFSADSTSVRANAQWPNDSSLIYKLLRRAVSILCGFADDKKYCRLKTKLLVKWLEQLRVTARDIDLQAGKSNAIEARKKLYADLVATARKLADRLGTQWDHVSDVVEAIDLRPTDCRLRDLAIDDVAAVFLVGRNRRVGRCQSRRAGRYQPSLGMG